MSPADAPNPIQIASHANSWLWLAVLAGVMSLACTGWLLFWQPGKTLRLLQHQRLENQALVLSGHLERRANAYIGHLQNLRARLTDGDPAIGNSVELARQALVAGLASARNIRLLSGSEYAQLNPRLLRGATLEQPIEAARGAQVLTLVAPVANPPPGRQTPGVAMDIALPALLQEALLAAPIQGARAELPGIRQAQAAPAPNNGEGAAALYLDTTMTLFDQPVTIRLIPAGTLLSAAEQRLPWPAGLLAAIAAAAFLVCAAQALRHQSLLRRYARRLYWLNTRTNLRYKALLQQPLLATAEINSATGRILGTTPYFATMLGYAQNDMPLLTIQAITHQDDQPNALPSPAADADSSAAPFSMRRTRFIHKDGHTVWVNLFRINHWPARSLDWNRTKPSAALLVALDLSAEKTLEEHLQRNTDRYSHILQHMPVGLCIVDSQGRVEFMNAQFRANSGLGEQPLTQFGDWWSQVIPNPRYRRTVEEHWHSHCAKALAGNGIMEKLELAITLADGSGKTLELAGLAMDNALVFTLMDLSRRKQAEEEILYLAFYDPLTGLPNRKLMLDRLQQALVTSTRYHWHGAVLILAPDSLQSISSTSGHPSGDALLCELANRLRTLVPQDQTIARIGGDEFVVVLSALAAAEDETARQCKELGAKIMAAMREPFEIQGRSHYASISIGIAVFQGTATSPQELLRRADLALHQARLGGRNTLQFFDPAMQAQAQARAALEADIRAGMALEQFMLYFQPQLDRHRITGAEALLRWRHGEHDFVAPDKFIATAEESNLILPLGHWVLYQACRQLSQWAQNPATAGLSLAVNVSPKQFKQDNFVQQVISALASTGAPAQRLKLELTEGVLLEDVETAVVRMAEIRAYGVRFSLDDFGTGYSSLSHLQSLPISELKIDRSFIQHVTSNANDASIVRTITTLGHSLGLHVIAEGVETQEQCDFLMHNGCHAWQGFLAGKPMPLEAFEHLLADQAAGRRPALH